MQIAGLGLSVVSALVAAVSAWLAWRATRPLPQIAVRLTTVFTLRGEIGYEGEEVPSGELGFIVHVQVTNLSIHPVQLVNYELEVIMQDRKRHVMHKPWQVTATLPMDLDSRPIEAHFDASCLWNWPPKAIGYGELSMGFLIFTDKGAIGKSRVAEYEVTVRDVFGGRHTARVTEADCVKWRKEQSRQSMNVLQLFSYSGVRVTNAES